MSNSEDYNADVEISKKTLVISKEKIQVQGNNARQVAILENDGYKGLLGIYKTVNVIVVNTEISNGKVVLQNGEEV